MYKKILLLVTSIFLVSCSLETPKEFTEEALVEPLVSLSGEKFSLETVLQKHKGKKILIDVWASWCRDCLEGLPKVKKLQSEFTDVVFLFLSVDERNSSWKSAVNVRNITGEHYNLPKGMKEGALVNFLNLRWIPRYLVINEQGEITLFKATNALDFKIKEALQLPL